MFPAQVITPLALAHVPVVQTGEAPFHVVLAGMESLKFAPVAVYRPVLRKTMR